MRIIIIIKSENGDIKEAEAPVESLEQIIEWLRANALGENTPEGDK